MPELNVFLISPLFDHVLLSKGLVFFTIFLLLIRFFPEFPRKLILLLVSLVLIEIATSPLYVFLFILFTGGIYYLLLYWVQWSPKKKEISYVLSGVVVLLYFLFLDLPAFHTPWTGQMVHIYGISYSLYRILALILDVGRGVALPTDPLDYFVFTFFVPTFFQGPIERLQEFKDNLVDGMSLSWRETGSYLIRISVAFVKGWIFLRFFQLDWKNYFDYPQQFSYSYLVIGMYVRAISFYLFASAANDFTISCCGLAGYKVHENFDSPYFKRNLAQFWRAWHMTLTRFARDYIYIPLGGNKKHIYWNYLIVFMFIALWHVTSPAFVIWGLWHGVGLCVLKLWQDFWQKRGGSSFSKKFPRITAFCSGLFTFHYVALGWLPFWGGHPQGLSMILRILSGNHWKLFVWDR